MKMSEQSRASISLGSENSPLPGIHQKEMKRSLQIFICNPTQKVVS